MNLHEIFKSIFGIDGYRPSHPGNSYDEQDGEDQDSRDCHDRDGAIDDFCDTHDGADHFTSFGNLDGMFQHFHSDMRQQMDEMHRQMDDIFKHFGAMDSSDIDPEANEAIEGVPKSHRGHSLRDNMLKEPDSNGRDEESKSDRSIFSFPHRFRGIFTSPISPEQKTDEDVEDVATDDIARIYDSFQDPCNNATIRPPSHYTKVSVRRIRKADGTVHEVRTVCDAHGYCHTTTTHTSDTPALSPQQSPLPAHDHHNSGFLGGLKKLWPWKNENSYSEDLRSDESVYQNIFGRK